MSVIKKTKEELEDIASIRTLSGVMRDLSVTRVQRLRTDFQKNLEFYKEIEILFSQVQNLVNEYYSSIAAEMYSRPSANVAITSNHRFYGSLNQDVMKLFLKKWNEAEDHIVVGRTGEGFMKTTEHHHKCRYIFFEDDNPTRWEMQKIVSLAKGYSRAVVFFPQYKTPFYQTPSTADIVRLVEKESDFKDDLSQFIFEPDLPLIHDFFSTQVQYVLIQRIMLETDLSRTAMRLVRMDTAESSAGEMYLEKKRHLRSDIQKQLDVHLAESLSGYYKNE